MTRLLTRVKSRDASASKKLPVYQQIYVTKTCARRAYRHPSMFKTPQMLAVDIQYKYILQNVHSPTQRVHRNPPTGIYVPTFWGIHVSWRSSVHPSGAGLGNVHFVTYIFVSDICGQHLGDVCQLEVFCAPLMYILDICCPHLGNKCQLILYISPGPNCPGGPTVHFFRADSWSPDS